MDEFEAQNVIKQFDRDLETFDRAYEEGRWLKNQGRLSSQDQSNLEIRRAEIILNEKVEDIVNAFIDTTQDPLFRRLLFVIDRQIKNAKIESNPSVYKIKTKIEQAIINYPIFIAEKRVTRTDIRQILRTEPHPKLRQQAMDCFNGLSVLVESDLRELIRQRNILSRELGYAHFGELALELQGLNRSEMNDWFNSIIRGTETIYQSFINESAEKIDQNCLYPQDLSYVVTKFATLPDNRFTSKHLSESISWLAQRLNLSKPLSQIQLDFIDIPWQGLCVTVHVPDDIRILINPSDGHSYYATFFHEVGHAMHSAHINQPFHVFRDEPGPFCEGMADTLARYVEDPDWLRDCTLLPEELLDQNKSKWRKRTMVAMRTQIGLAEFEWKMYEDPEADLLNLYKTIMGDCLKASYNDKSDWAENMFWTSYPFYVQNYVISEMIASQTHLALRRLFGRSINPESGLWFAQNYWNPGGSIEWSEKIIKSTGELLSPNELIQEMIDGYPLQ